MICNFIVSWFIAWIFTVILGFGYVHLSSMQFWLLVGLMWIFKTCVDYVFDKLKGE